MTPFFLRARLSFPFLPVLLVFCAQPILAQEESVSPRDVSVSPSTASKPATDLFVRPQNVTLNGQMLTQMDVSAWLPGRCRLFRSRFSRF